jgi:hypothetical protein
MNKKYIRFLTVLNNTLKPTKPFYKIMLEKQNVRPAKSQEKWQIRLEKEIVKELKFPLGLWMDYHEYLHNVK